jgi:hypothetical protein
LADIDMRARLRKALAIGGDVYDVADIIEAVHDGKMQVFSRGDTALVVTEIGVFPRKKVLNVVALCGKLEDVMSMHDELVAFAREQGCAFISSFGRPGWSRVLPEYGWRRTGVVHAYDLGV